MPDWEPRDFRGYRRGQAMRSHAISAGLWHPGCGRHADDVERTAAILGARAAVLVVESAKFAQAAALLAS